MEFFMYFIFIHVKIICQQFQISSIPHMLRPVKHDKRSSHKKSKSFRSNMAIHPFVIAAILTALTLVIFICLIYFFRYLK